jgi:excisionase family DNA binding protein
MTDPVEVTVLNPAYWADKSLQLAQLLGGGATGPVGDPTGRAPDPETLLTVVDTGYWSAQPRELEEALRIGAGTKAQQSHGGSGLASGAAPAGTERLTLTVEEAATALGISRAFAYESVRRGDIPHIKIGRRLLIPKAKLNELLDSATAGGPEKPSSS